jgi:hypothetical protein
VTTRRVLALWVVGALLIVPYAVHQLLYHAQRDQYALLIVVPLFWLFGFWGVVGPLLAIARIRKLMRAVTSAKDRESVRLAFERNEGEQVIVDLLARELKLPERLARMVYRKLAETLGRAMVHRVPVGGSRATLRR